MIKSLMKKIAILIIFYYLSLSLMACSEGPIKVEIVKQDTGFKLLRDGKPYFIKGAGLEFGEPKSLSEHGGNSMRSWSTKNAQEMLDKAHKSGVTVSLGLQVKPERWGFDYSDEALVKKQFEFAKQEVLKYREHPAVLTWIIGNELNHSYTNPQVYDAVNDISKMIHELDPNHPTTTTIAGIREEEIKLVNDRAADLDFISIQVYGLLDSLPAFLKKINYQEPLMVTEWGAIGYWEMESTSWGAPIEMTSTEKANNYLKGFQQKLKSLGTQLIGNYVFLWGQKQERTPTWFGLFTESGEYTEASDVMYFLWNDKWPDNRAPKLNSMLLDNKHSRDNIILSPAQAYTAQVISTDLDDDPLRYHWEIKVESGSKNEGGDFEENIENLEGLITENNASELNFIAPSSEGAYRLFVYVYDDKENAAHANIPFYVK